MSKTTVNKQLLLFLFMNTLDLEYSKKILKNTHIKLHTKNKNLTDNDFFKNTLAKLLLKKNISHGEVSLESFKKDCVQFFKEKPKINFHLWFLFFKRSIKSERETFIISQILKLKESEIADIQNVTSGTVRSRISGCYDKITEVIKNG